VANWLTLTETRLEPIVFIRIDRGEIQLRWRAIGDESGPITSLAVSTIINTSRELEGRNGAYITLGEGYGVKPFANGTGALPDR
jgi:hypothetical protein